LNGGVRLAKIERDAAGYRGDRETRNMGVELILAEKGRSVITMRPTQTLADAAETLSRHRIGAAVVVDENDGVLGIISERDMVRAVAEIGAKALEEPLSRRMTTKVVTCTSHTGMDQLMGLMTQGKFRHIPVVEAGKLIGIVSIGDIVKHRLAEVEAEHKALRDYIATA
jgi:CBS domain-containing protein